MIVSHVDCHDLQARGTATTVQSMSLNEQMMIASQVASGMLALANQRIVHGALAAFVAYFCCYWYGSFPLLQKHGAGVIKACLQTE